MGRALVILSVLAALVPAFFALISGASPSVVENALTLAVLFVIILGIIAVAILVTYLYLVLFGAAADGYAKRHVALFVGWKFLRSQRTGETLLSRLRRAAHAVRTRAARPKLVHLGLALALLASYVVLGRPAPWNALAESVSPPFATALRFSALGLGVLFALVGLYGLLFRTRRAPPDALMRQRSAVTLPTFISIVGVAVGLWALIVVLGVMHGLQSDLREKILRTNAHLMVDPASPSGALGDAIALERAVRALPEVVEASAYVRGDVMVSSPSGIAPNVVIKGMVPEQLIASDQLRGRLVSGTFDGLNRPDHLVSDRGRYPTQGSLKRNGRPPAPDDDRYLIDLPHDVFPGILVGAELARQLNVEVGDELQLISPDGDVGPTGLRPKLASFRVSGVFMTGMYEYDQKLGYIALDAAQRFFDLGRERNAIEARLSDPAFVSEVAPVLRDLLAREYPTLTASTFQERNKSLFAALALERLVMFVVLGFIILVAGLLIVVSLVMLVVEKVREVAVLKALGAANGTVVKSFISIGAFIGFFGILAGVPLGIGTCILLMYNGIVARKEFYIQTLPVKLEAFEIILFALSAMAICLLATVYPALRASRLRPVDGLRHG